MKFHTKIQDYFGRSSFSKNLLPAAFAAALLLAPVAAMALPMYTITDLGDLPGGGNYSYATGINDRGQVVGYSMVRYNEGYYNAFFWDNGVMTDLGELPGGRDESFAYGINDRGQVVGNSSVTSGNHGFLWQNGVMTDLGTLPGSDFSIGAYGINDRGQVVGQGATATGFRTFLWDNGVMTDIGDLPGGADASYATGINNSGQVVGIGTGSSGGPQAFLWQSGTMTGLGALPGGFGHSYANDINNIGQVVGQSGGSGPAEAGYARAFLWDESAGMRDLGFLPGADVSVAHGINDGGEVVGESFSLSGAGGAFLWDDSLGMLNLNDLLIDSGDWRLWNATAINNSGQIVGHGLHNAAQHAFLLTPTDATPATNIQYININSNGEITGESFNPAFPTVVVTHGWQPEADNPLSRSFPLADVSQAVAARAIQDDQPLNLITYQWAAAYTREIGPFDITSGATAMRYNASAEGTVAAGALLGFKLNNLFEDNSYTGNVHMIGHSLGTVVNAEAVNRFSANDIIDQFTILDAPSDLPFDSFLNFDSSYFNARLLETKVRYVDNFYGDTTYYFNGVTAFGAAIDNAADNGGTALSGLGHTEVHEQFYSPRIGETGWVTPIFGLDYVDFFARSGPQIWDPWQPIISVPESAALNDFPAWTATQGSVEIATLGLDVGGPYSETIAMVLNPHSPVSITRPFEIPGDATLLSFDFGFLDPGTGEFLQLYFDDILLWEMPWMNDLIGELLNAVVPIGALAGRSGDLTFLLDSITGDASARAFIANFEVMGVAALTADPVPEPGTLLLLGAGLLALARLRYSMACQAGMRRKLAA